MYPLRNDYYLRDPTNFLQVDRNGRQYQVSKVKSIGIGPGSLIDSVLLVGNGFTYRISPGNPLPLGNYDGNFIVEALGSITQPDADQFRIQKKMGTRVLVASISTLLEYSATFGMTIAQPPAEGLTEMLYQPLLELLVAETNEDFFLLSNMKGRAPYARGFNVSNEASTTFVNGPSWPCHGRRVIEHSVAMGASNPAEVQLLAYHVASVGEVGEVIWGPITVPPNSQISVSFVDRAFTWVRSQLRSTSGAVVNMTVATEVRD